MTRKNKRPSMMKGTVPGRTYPAELEDWAEDDLDDLPNDVREKAVKVLDALETMPRAFPLEGVLDGWYSRRFNKMQHRIVFRLKDDSSGLLIRTIGKKKNEEVYEVAKERTRKS